MNNTRVVKLWIANEEPSYLHIEALATEALEQACDNESHATSARNDAIEALASQIEEFVCESMPCVKGMWGDLIASALQDVDFEEVAKDILDDRRIYSVFSSDSEDAELFTDEDLARQHLLEKLDSAADPEGELIASIEILQPGQTVCIEGTDYTMVVS